MTRRDLGRVGRAATLVTGSLALVVMMIMRGIWCLGI